MQLFDNIIVDNGIYKLWVTWTVYKDWFLQRRRAYNACQIPPHLGYLNDLCVSCINKNLKLYSGQWCISICVLDGLGR